VAQGPDGLLYVASADSDQVLRYDGSTGAFLAVFADEADLLRSPAGMRFGPNGNLFVCNRLRNEVLEFDLSGVVLNVYETTTTGAPVLTPEDVAVGPDGRLYVASANTNTVVRFTIGSPDGEVFVAATTGLDYPHGLAFSGTDLFVSSHLSNEVFRVDNTGALVSSFASVADPVGIAFDDQGDLNVVSFGSGLIRRFDGTNGAALTDLPVASTASFLTVVDRPRVSGLSRNPTSVVGGCQTSTFTATLDRPAPTGGVNVVLTSSLPDVIVPATVVVPEGATSTTFIANTEPVAANVTASITAAAFGTQRTSFLTVKPVGLAAGVNALVLSPTTVNGGSTSTGTVTLFCAANIADVTVALSSADPAIAALPASVTVPFGSQTATFAVTTTAPAASTTVSLAATLDRTQSRNITVVQGTTLTAVNLSAVAVSGGLSVTGTVTISSPAPAGGVVLTLSTSNTSLAQVPATVTVQAGNTVSAPFAVTTSATATSTSVAIRATFNSSTASRSLLVRPSSVQTVALSPTTVRSTQTSTGTITLDTPAAAAGIVVNLSSTAPGVAAPTVASITIPGGQLTGTFTVLAGTVAVRSTARITGAVTGTTSKFAVVTVNP
jgi:sugar lactone lactonase YvrE